MLTKTLAVFTIFFLLLVAVSASVVPRQKPNGNATSRPPPTTSPPPTKTNVVPTNRRVTSKFVTDFVSAHNAVRLLIGHSPLTWNYTVAYFAEQWAKKRANDCKLIHSYGPYGENLFWGGGATDWSPAAVVKSWAAEQAFYDPKSNSCAKNHMCGHYTQIVWKDTLRVGCASVKCNNNKGSYVVCNYDPPGNYLNEHPFGNLSDIEKLLKKLHTQLPKKPAIVVPKLPMLPKKAAAIFPPKLPMVQVPKKSFPILPMPTLKRNS